MILIEITTTSDKTIALADNGVLSIKHKNFETCFGKLNSEQANTLALALVQWASTQPSEKETKPYYGDDPECVPGN